MSIYKSLFYLKICRSPFLNISDAARPPEPLFHSLAEPPLTFSRKRKCKQQLSKTYLHSVPGTVVLSSHPQLCLNEKHRYANHQRMLCTYLEMLAIVIGCTSATKCYLNNLHRFEYSHNSAIDHLAISHL